MCWWAVVVRFILICRHPLHLLPTTLTITNACRSGASRPVKCRSYCGAQWLNYCCFCCECKQRSQFIVDNSELTFVSSINPWLVNQSYAIPVDLRITCEWNARLQPVSLAHYGSLADPLPCPIRVNACCTPVSTIPASASLCCSPAWSSSYALILITAAASSGISSIATSADVHVSCCIHPLEQLASWYSVILLLDRFLPQTKDIVVAPIISRHFVLTILTFCELCNNTCYFSHIENADLLLLLFLLSLLLWANFC